MVASNSGILKFRNRAGFSKGKPGPTPGFWMAKRPMTIASKLHKIITSPIVGVHDGVAGTVDWRAASIVIKLLSPAFIKI
jgi:hypothetical protein